MRLVIEKIMKHHSLQAHPPVLVDIGASGVIHEKWKPIAKYSICIAFDADTRDFEACYYEDKGWYKLYSFNRLVAQKTVDKTFKISEMGNKLLQLYGIPPLFSNSILF